MRYKITAPYQINTSIHLPASKSISNRALVISAMAHDASGEALILPSNLSNCDDTEVIVNALKDMPEIIDIKAAGTAMRFMTAYLSLKAGETHTLTGTERMQHRPIKILVDGLRKLGANIEYVKEEGYPPLRIRGERLKGGKLEIPGNVSSQYISALLMVGPMMSDGLRLTLVGDIVSRPYIDLTLCTMRDYGASVEWTSIDTTGIETIMSQWDSVQIWGIECDTVPYIEVKNQSKLWLPLRVDTAVTTYQILWHKQLDFITIHHTNDRQFISNACGCMVYHTIDTVLFGGAFIDSVEVLNTIVSGTTEENILLYLRGN